MWLPPFSQNWRTAVFTSAPRSFLLPHDGAIPETKSRFAAVYTGGAAVKEVPGRLRVQIGSYCSAFQRHRGTGVSFVTGYHGASLSYKAFGSALLRGPPLLLPDFIWLQTCALYRRYRLYIGVPVSDSRNLPACGFCESALFPYAVLGNPLSR